MKARIAETGDRLVIRLRPVKVWAYWLFGLAFIAAGAWVLLLLGRGVHLSCPADPKGECELARVVVVGWKGESFPVAELAGARVDTVTAAGTARMDLVLQTTSGDRTLALVAADGAEKIGLAQTVRRYVADPASGPLDIREDSRRFGIPLALLVALGGVLILLAYETVVIAADRSTGILLIRSRRFRRSRSVELRLDEIEDISTPSWHVRGAESYSLVLHLKGRREQSLTRTPLFTVESAGQVRDAIMPFLVPRT